MIFPEYFVLWVFFLLLLISVGGLCLQRYSEEPPEQVITIHEILEVR